MRTTWNLNADWVFTKEDDIKWQKENIVGGEAVNIPHTWNAFDGQDGGSNYYRDGCWYQKMLELPAVSENQALTLQFNAVNAVAEVYLDGTLLGTHSGGYSAFRFDVTAWAGKTVLLSVRADNADSPDVYPRTADYTFYGGIYRDVMLNLVPKVRFGNDTWATNGIYIDTEVKDNEAVVSVRAEILGEAAARYTILDAEGNVVVSSDTGSLTLVNPRLWDGKADPCMYTLKAQLLDGEAMVDEVLQPFGIRYFHNDPEQGFFLNGHSYRLRGVSRHQDRRDKGWAIGKKEHEEDMAMIVEIGATSMRLAHYQHDGYFYDLCDKNGLVIWAEIPFISQMSNTPGACQNLRTQMTELVLQNYNHPSICIWGLGNETTITNVSGGGEEDMSLTNMVDELNQICKRLNPARLTTQALLENVKGSTKMANISDLVAYNHYYGWYIGEPEGLAQWFDKFHRENPHLMPALSEYGGDGSPRFHNDNPQPSDYSEDYQALLHEKLQAILHARPYIWGTYVWNMFDFGSDRRDEGGAPGINQKGLVTYDRKIKKDAFYLYKAYWSDVPFVHICGHTYVNRTAKKRQIKVYSNQPSVTLSLNGQEVGTVEADKVFTFTVDLPLGENTITAVSGGVSETIAVVGVEKYDTSYKMTELEGKAGIVNWFDNADDFHFVEGCYSVNDRAAELMKIPEGRAVLEKYFNPFISMEMLELAINFKVVKWTSKLGKAFTPAKVVELNDELGKIRKCEE